MAFNKILVALSMADYSINIFKYAAQLAESLNGNLIIGSIINSRDVDAVGSISSMGYNVDGEHYVQSVKDERKTFFDKIITESGFPKERIRVVLRVGNPIGCLLQMIIEEKADMIVMGPKGRSDLENVLVGSVADKIFRQSPIPVVSYRGGEHAEKLKRRILKHIPLS